MKVQGGFFMNKQALAFISMFTLVLMLSVYYVSLEEENSQIPNNEVVDVMAMMHERNEEEKDNKLLELKEVLGSKQSSEEKKKEVLTQIETIESNTLIEKKIIDKLKEKGIKSLVVIDEKIVKVNIFEIEKSDQKANEIMNVIYTVIKPNQSIELVFS